MSCLYDKKNLQQRWREKAAQVEDRFNYKNIKSVIVSIWDVNRYKDKEQRENLLTIIKKMDKHVDAYSIGNNGLTRGRYSFEDLSDLIRVIREEVKKTVTTTEPIAAYYNDARLYYISDFLFPDIHGVWYDIYKDKSNFVHAIEEIESSIRLLQEKLLYDLEEKKIVLVKYVGFPSGDQIKEMSDEESTYKQGSGEKRDKDKRDTQKEVDCRIISIESNFSLETQKLFFDSFMKYADNNSSLSAPNISFSYFDVFDHSWKWKEKSGYPAEACTGLITENHELKPAANTFLHR